MYRLKMIRNTDPIKPTASQVANAKDLGWEYDGDMLFSKGELIGYYSKIGFIKL